MDPEAAAVVTPHLLVGEALLWCGRPQDTTALLRWRTVVIILVGIAALAMRSIPLDHGAAKIADNASAQLAVLVCVLIAEAIVFHTYLSNTFYGVTDQRVIIASGLRDPEVTSVFLGLLNTPRLRVRRFHRNVELIPTVKGYGVSGTLPFTNPSLPPSSILNKCYRLFALEDPRRVYDLIVESTNNLR
jgi:hypothetical protein